MEIWPRGGKREVYWNMKERGIWEYGRDKGRERNMRIWQRGGKREKYWNMVERREERKIWVYGRD